MNFLYQIGIHLFILFLRIASLFNTKIKEGIDGRKNWTNAFDDIPENSHVIWFHCASLGEFDQGLPVMNELKKRHPKSFLLVTFFLSLRHESLPEKRPFRRSCHVPPIRYERKCQTIFK